MDDLESRALDLVRGHLQEGPQLSLEDNLYTETKTDSLLVVEIQFLLEDEFGVDLHGMDIPVNKLTVGMLVDEIRRQTARTKKAHRLAS
jgi:acyl carrier protein